MNDGRALLLPAGARMLHIGPHKTGTTAIQGAFHVNRAEIERQGVHYAGATSQPNWQVLSVLAKENPTAQVGAPRTTRSWRRLMREVERAARKRRVVISSEFFADASPAAVRRIVRDVGPDAHVVVTLRPLSRILPSQWQQYVKSGMSTGYEDWLDAMFHRRHRTKLSPTFWHRHRHDDLIARWADEVGPDRVTVLVVDPHDRMRVLRDVEGLVGLEPGTLELPKDADNRSLTLPEVELIREFNMQLKAAGIGKAVQHQAIRFGASPYLQMRQPEQGEPRIATPRWALEEAGRVGTEMAANIEASGVRVVGDLASLGIVPESDGDEPASVVPFVDTTVAARAAIGVMHASSLPESFGAGAGARRPGVVRGLSSRGILRLARNRLVRLLRRS